MTVVMNHLVKSYIRVTCGGKVSTATRRILLHMDRIPDMGFFFRRQERAVLFLRWIRPSLTACNMPLPPVVGQPPAACRLPGVRFLLRCRRDPE